MVVWFLVTCIIGCKNEDQEIKLSNKFNNKYEQSATEAPMKNKQSSCPVIENRQWHAQLVQQEQMYNDEPQFKLMLSGDLSLPTPGYRHSWSKEIIDDTSPPNLKLDISFSEPQQMVIQVVSSKTIKHTIDTSKSSFGRVMVFCGDTLLADIKNVKAE